MKKLLTILTLMVVVAAHGAFQTSVQSGLFSATNTWGGTVPVDGEGFKINTNHTVIYDTNNLNGVGWQNVTNCGFLYFSNGLSVPTFGTTGFLMASNMAGTGGTLQVGNPDNLMGFTSSNTASTTIKWLKLSSSSCASTVLVYAVTNHLLQTFIATNGAANDTYIVCSNLPASIASNDVVIIGSTNRGAVVDPCIVSAVTNNTVWLKQALSSETNNWSTGFSNKCNNAKQIGVPVAFINVPVIFTSTNDVNSVYPFSVNGSSYQGARFDMVNVGSTINHIFNGCVFNGHTSAGGTTTGGTVYATNCYLWKNASNLGIFGNASALYLDSCYCIQSSQIGFFGNSGQANSLNCVSFNCANGTGTAGTLNTLAGSYGLLFSNYTAYYSTESVFAMNGGIIKNSTVIGCDGVFGNSAFVSTYNLFVYNSTLITANSTIKGMVFDTVTNNSGGQCFLSQNAGSATANTMVDVFYSNVTGGIPTNNVFGYVNTLGGNNYLRPVVFSTSTSKKWLYTDGSAYLTNGIITYSLQYLATNAAPHVAAYFPLSIRPNATKTVTVQYLRTNNVSYFIQFNEGSIFNPAVPIVGISSPLADNAWVSTNITYRNTSVNPINATISVMCTATNNNAAGYSKVFIGQDNQLNEF